MKKVIGLFFVLVLVLFFAGCGKQKRTLHLYSWADYLADELVAEFEQKYDCRIVYDTFDSNEALIAKLQAGASGYDIIIPSHYIVDMLAKNGRLEKLDKSKLPQLVNLDTKAIQKLQKSILEYSVPYTLSYTGLGYNKKVLPNFEPSWAMFERPELRKRATMLDDKREVIGAALAYLGLNLNSTDPKDLAKAKEVIIKWSKNISKYDNEQYKNGIASSEFFLVMGYSGDMLQVIDENPEIGFAIPKEGALMCSDVLAIPTSAKNKDLAYAFINFMYEPKHCAVNIEHIGYLCPNKNAYPLLPERIRKNPAIFITDEVYQKSAFTEDLGEKEVILNQLWSEIKAARSQK